MSAAATTPIMSIFPVTQLLPTAIASVIAFSLWKVLRFLWRYNSPLRHLQGPKGTSLLLGNFNEISNDENGELMEHWVKEYGETLRFKGLLNRDQLLTVDTRAINHVLTHSDDYQKPRAANKGLAKIFDTGLLLVEGTQHRQQRRIMNPAFGPAQVRALTDTFLAKASHLRDIWSSEIAKNPTAAISGTRIDMVPWSNKVTLDIIGLTGFNYNINSLDSSLAQPNEFGEAFLSISQNITILDVVLAATPVLGLIPTPKARRLWSAKQIMRQVSTELLKNAKATALAGEAGKEEIEKNGLRGRDLLSLLVKANMATDVPESQRLSDEDVIPQVSTFLVAGHEATSAAMIWAVYAMTQAPEVQKKLRDELLSVDTDSPSMDELMALPYLDAVVKETLRLYAPVTAISRVAMKDDVLPVEKPYVDRYGAIRNSIPIAKDDELVIPILTMNRSKELWGPDACEFKPERWNDVPEAVCHVPGIWGHLMTFIGGPRACIGYRFSLVEFKAILFVLVRAFEFELAVPASDITSRIAITQRPVLRSDPTHKAQLPLLVRPYQRT